MEKRWITQEQMEELKKKHNAKLVFSKPVHEKVEIEVTDEFVPWKNKC